MTQRRKRAQIFCNTGIIDVLSLTRSDLRDIQRNTKNGICQTRANLVNFSSSTLVFGRKKLNGCTELDKFHCSASCDLQIWFWAVIIGLRLLVTVLHLNLKSPNLQILCNPPVLDTLKYVHTVRAQEREIAKNQASTILCAVFSSIAQYYISLYLG